MRVPPSTTDVVIAGAGPTGLVLSCVLTEAGVSNVIVDRQGEGANTSRAVAIHARTLEVLEPLRVTDRLRAEGHVVTRVVVRDRDRVVARVAFDRLPTRYPFVLMLPQCRTEAILTERLRDLGGDVLWSWAVSGVLQDADGVMVTVGSESQPSHTIRSRFVVGADGMYSTVRERAGIAFEGEAYEPSFILADVRMSWGLGRHDLMAFLSPEGMVVVAPLPGDRYRIVATVDAAPEHPGLRDVQALLDGRGPTIDPARVGEVVWSSRFRVHHRVAERYRQGRILLAGDAAHVHSPAGGQGMNTGIQDAVALGRAIVDVLQGRTGEERLDEYGQARRRVAQRVVAFTDRLTRVATLRSTGARRVRNAVVGLVAQLPAVPLAMATELAGLRHR